MKYHTGKSKWGEISDRQRGLSRQEDPHPGLLPKGEGKKCSDRDWESDASEGEGTKVGTRFQPVAWRYNNPKTPVKILQLPDINL